MGFCSQAGEMAWKEGAVKMAPPAFKGFLAHAHEGKDVPTSDANDGRRKVLRLCTGAFVADAGRPTHAHAVGTCASFRTWKCSLTGG